MATVLLGLLQGVIHCVVLFCTDSCAALAFSLQPSVWRVIAQKVNEKSGPFVPMVLPLSFFRDLYVSVVWGLCGKGL